MKLATSRLAALLVAIVACDAFAHYDPNKGRFLSRDPIEEDGGMNMYAIVGNNMVAFIDPLGLETYVLLWNTRPGDVGHAAIAYPRYLKLDTGGEAKSPYYDFREFGPAVRVSLDNFNARVPGSHNSSPVTKDGIYNEAVSNYDKLPASALIRIDTSPEQEAKLQEALDLYLKANPQYAGIDGNCTSFVVYGLKTIFGDKVSADESLGKYTMQTPNELLNNLRKLTGDTGRPETLIVKDPGSVITFKEFVEQAIASRPFFQRPIARKHVEEAIGASR